MIKKLRKRFILIALGVVAAVILSVAAGLDIASYVTMTRDADDILYNLGSGTIGAPMDPSQQDAGGEIPDAEPHAMPSDAWNALPPQGLPREISFSARYFIVETDKEGNVTGEDLKRIAYVRTDEVANYVSEATADSGFVGNYRYRREETESGYKYIFLDCEKEIAAYHTFVIAGAFITVFGLLVIALLIVLLSGRALRPVEESYEKQKRFITDAGHELKTPLTVISANAELLELDLGEDNEWLASIKGQVKKLNKLTKELVFLSRMDEENRALSMAPFSLKNALEEVMEGLKESAIIKGKNVLVEAEDVTVSANEEMVRRALGLILDNAIKYAESEEIRVTLRRDGKYAVVEETNAASLPKGEHAELFERFYRPDVSRTSETGGHGIGLSVVKSVAEAHKGTATCTSDGANVTFRITLPMA